MVAEGNDPNDDSQSQSEAESKMVIKTEEPAKTVGEGRGALDEVRTISDSPDGKSR